MRRIYLDHSATTPVRNEVLEAMLPFLKNEAFGNPSSVYSYGREARNAVEEAREKVAALIGAGAREIYFTSGGTEADNLALLGTATAYENKGRHIITSSIEHHAVLDTLLYMQKHLGYKVTFLPVTPEGLVRVEDVEKAITPETVLISIMHVNNEVGTIQPIAEIGRIAREKGVIFHTDAVQSAGKIPIHVEDMRVDILTASAHKIYGPKGVGCIYIRKGVKTKPLFHGGAQERKKRPGTENVPGIVGFGRAVELAGQEMDRESKRLTVLRDKLIDGIMNKVENVRLNGHRKNRLANNANFSFSFIEGEALLLGLDMKGICASSGSACSSGSLEPSHVLIAMGIPVEVAHGSVRMTLGRENTEEDIEYVLEVIPETVARLRSMSPFYKKKSTM